MGRLRGKSEARGRPERVFSYIYITKIKDHLLESMKTNSLDAKD